jgi:hypothetical protein
MQRVIFLSTFLERDSTSLNRRVLFPLTCIKRFLKAIVFLNKKVKTFFLIRENQHFLSRGVGFFLFERSVNQYNN